MQAPDGEQAGMRSTPARVASWWRLVIVAHIHVRECSAKIMIRLQLQQSEESVPDVGRSQDSRSGHHRMTFVAN
jgi:hypothetical protein